jgi:omega-6 fatty acid desaturase (delta-12 desaturase)
VKVWWDKMLLFKPTNLQPKEKAALLLSKWVVAVFAIILAAALYIFAGVVGVIAGLIMPFLIFNYFIAFYVYLHHTHPEVTFFDERQEWNHAIGMIQCTTVIRCSRWWELLNHNILIHTPHHIDVRIPFYHLKRAYGDLQQDYHQYMHEYRFSWGEVSKIFKQCKLYDYKAKKWYGFEKIR